jgi:hypothetical protein
MSLSTGGRSGKGKNGCYVQTSVPLSLSSQKPFQRKALRRDIGVSF